MRLEPGQAAKPFQVTDIAGNDISLETYRDKKLLLSFYRYAACPLCNLRVHNIIQQLPGLHEKGLHVLAFFESSKESILKHVGKQEAPFPVIPDPGLSVYKAYGVESSWPRFLMSMVIKMPTIIKAMFSGFPPGKLENKFAMLPADFLIGPDLKIERAYYGSNIGDHLHIREIEAWL